MQNVFYLFVETRLKKLAESINYAQGSRLELKAAFMPQNLFGKKTLMRRNGDSCWLMIGMHSMKATGC